MVFAGHGLSSCLGFIVVGFGLLSNSDISDQKKNCVYIKSVWCVTWTQDADLSTIYDWTRQWLDLTSVYFIQSCSI